MRSLSLVKMVGGNFLSVILLMEIIVNAFIFGVDGLSMNYYLMSCPFADSIVKNTVNSALQDDPTLAAGLIRMHFHDCFIEVLSLSLTWVLKLEDLVIVNFLILEFLIFFK